MLSNENSKVKYPSFRIDDILNNNGRRSSSPGLTATAKNTEDHRRKTVVASEFEDKLDQFDEKFDQPINLSSMKYTEDENFDSPFASQKYDHLNENKFKNKSSISSSSPTLSVGSSDSPTFNQFSPTFKSPAIDHLIKSNLNDTNSSKVNLLNSSLFSDECNHLNSLSNHNFPNSLFVNPPALYSHSIEDFYLKMNKNPYAEKSLSSSDYDRPVDRDISSPNLTIDNLKKIHQQYQSQQIANNSFLDQFQAYYPAQKDHSPSIFAPSNNNFAAPLNQPNSSFYVQQLYIRMKMLMQAKPRKGGQIRFNHQQTNELEAMFAIKKYLIPSERKQISKKLSLTERQVKTWFQNRRAKSRRSENYRG